MKLTKNEMEIADRFISKREKQLAQWPYRRWLIVIIFSASMLFGHRNVNDGMRSINDDRATDSQVDRALGDGPPPGLERAWVVGSMIKISRVLESRYQVMNYALMQVALGYIQVITGAIMVCLAILRWKPSERDALICKLLRMKLQKLESSTSLQK